MSLKGFLRPFSKQIYHGYLPKRRTKERFDPDAYKGLVNERYQFEERNGLGD